MNEMKTSIFKRIRWLLVTAVICGGMFLTKPTTAFGDVLILTDGTVVQGLILSKSPDQVYVKDRQGSIAIMRCQTSAVLSGAARWRRKARLSQSDTPRKVPIWLFR